MQMEDDEIYCYSCIKQCHCLGLAIACEISEISYDEKYVFESYLFVKIAYGLIHVPLRLNDIVKLSIIYSNLKELWQVFQPGYYLYLLVIEMTFNNMTAINVCPFNIYLDTLKHLDLSNNLIAKIADGSFRTLRLLKYLDVTNNLLKSITGNTFQGLVFLHSIKISGNPLQRVDINAFLHIFPQLIITESNQICCVKSNPKAICTANIVPGSNCEWLLPFKIFTVFGVLFAILVSIVNMMSIFISLSYLTHSATKTRRIFNTLKLALSFSDLYIAMHILIISLMNVSQGTKFIQNSMFWKQSLQCYLLSGLSLYSVLFSILLTLYLGLSRFCILKFPLNNPLNYNRLKRLLIVSTLVIASTTIIILLVFNWDGNYKIFTSLCFIPGERKLSKPLKVIDFTISIMFALFLLSTDILYYLASHTSLKQLQEISDMLQKQVKSNKLLTTVVMTIIVINIYYFTLSCLVFTSLFLKVPPKNLQFYIFFFVLPVNPLLNSFVYHCSEIKKLLVKLYKRIFFHLNFINIKVDT